MPNHGHHRRVNRDYFAATFTDVDFLHGQDSMAKPRRGLRSASTHYLGSKTRSFFFREPSEEEEGDVDPRWVHRLPSKPTVWDRLLFPIFSFLAWMRLLCDNFDGRFIVMVVCGQHLLKGLLAGGGSEGLLVVEGMIYMRLKVGASYKTVYQAIGSSAWGLKPLYALISDAITCGGYRRSQWVIMTAVIATLSYSLLALDSKHLSGAIVCLCFFCAKLQLSWTDLMVEATYTEKMEKAPKYSADIVSFAWSGIGLFGMVGILIAGPGVDYVGPVRILALAIPFSSVIIIPACMGYMTEKRMNQRQQGQRYEQLKTQWNYLACTMILTVGVLTTVVAGIVHVDSLTQALIAGLVCLVTGSSALALLPPTIWKPLIFMFLTNAFSIATGGFVDNFYLDAATPEESAATGFPVCHNCPHFSATFYYTIMGVFDSLFMMVGSYVFSRYMSNWTYRSALCVSTILSTCTGVLDIVQYQRWNLLFGLPDWVFMLGKSSVQDTIGMINFMPTTILISKVCPRGIEASVFALLAGFSNFGSTVSGYLGAYALTVLGLDTIGQGAVDDFSNAWKASVVGMIFAPLTLLLLPILIPAAAMTDELIREDEDLDEESNRLLSGSAIYDK